MLIRSLAIAAVATAFMATAAHATDLTVPSEPQPMMPDMAGTGFDWNGMYVGVEGGGLFYDSDNKYGVIGGNVGVNFVTGDNFVLGLEGDLQYLNDGSDYLHAILLGRAGVLVSPTILLYGALGAGIEHNIDTSDNYGIYEFGGGAEMAVTDNISLRGQVLGLGFFDNDDIGAKATLGLEFHL